MAEIRIDNRFSMKVGFSLKSLASIDCKRDQIWLSCSIRGQRVRIYTKLLIEPNLWLKKDKNGYGEMAKECASIGKVKRKECEAINERLKEILGYCHDYALRVVNNTLTESALEHCAESFKKFMNAKINGVSTNRNIDVETYINNYIAQKQTMMNKDTKRKLVSGTIYNHKNALSRLKKFCLEKKVVLNWKLFDRKFENVFTAWLCEQDYSANTISCQYSIMKTWLKEAEIDGYIKDKAFHKYPTKVYSVENIYLTEDEIQRLYDIDFNSKEVQEKIGYALFQGGHYEETRDLFCLACWTGLRYGEWKDMMSCAVIGENTMVVHTQKTNKEVVIPLHPMVKAIIEKYNGKLPHAVHKSRTLSQIRQCARIAGITAPTTICKVRGGNSILNKGEKADFILNHTARRSFATNLYLKGVPPISIMAVTGHTSEENFMKYIKVDKLEHAKIVAKAFL